MTPSAAPSAPTGLARRLVRYILGFGVGVGVGVAPFLGKLQVPGFEALLSLFPETLQRSMIPISAFLMGLVAVAVQFYSGETLSQLGVRQRFFRSLATLLVGLLILIVLYTLLVVRVPIEGGARSVPIILALSRSATCLGCPPAISDGECIARLSLNPKAIESCWGSRPLALSRLALTLAYLVLTGGFGALIGLLLLQEDLRSRERREAENHGDADPDEGDHPVL
ncbi:MAG TPA: hypothetical protein VOA80_07005 [Thermoanaerobaculia bacterium]|nr:hypothetical protein [Thermoanaerobaculia bacterium]